MLKRDSFIWELLPCEMYLSLIYWLCTNVSEEPDASISACCLFIYSNYFLILKMEDICPSDKSVNFYHSTRCHVRENGTILIFPKAS